MSALAAGICFFLLAGAHASLLVGLVLWVARSKWEPLAVAGEVMDHSNAGGPR